MLGTQGSSQPGPWLGRGGARHRIPARNTVSRSQPRTHRCVTEGAGFPEMLKGADKVSPNRSRLAPAKHQGEGSRGRQRAIFYRITTSTTPPRYPGSPATPCHQDSVGRLDFHPWQAVKGAQHRSGLLGERTTHGVGDSWHPGPRCQRGAHSTCKLPPHPAAMRGAPGERTAFPAPLLVTGQHHPLLPLLETVREIQLNQKV